MSDNPRNGSHPVPPGTIDRRARIRPDRTPMDPEAAAALIGRLKAGRERVGNLRAQQMGELLDDPLAHLSRFRRAEYEVVLRYLAYPDQTLKQLAASLGYKDWRSVQQILHRPHIVKTISEIRARQLEKVIDGSYGAAALLKASQVKAAKKVVETIDNPAAGVKHNLDAAKDVLDRTGLGKQTAVEHHHVHEILRHFTQEEIDLYGQKGVVPERFKTVFAQLEGPREDGE